MIIYTNVTNEYLITKLIGQLNIHRGPIKNKTPNSCP